MAARGYVPERGDVVLLAGGSSRGRGRTTAAVISPAVYNRKVGLALVCPVTTEVKGYPFEVPAPADAKWKGAILADQVQSLDWSVRRAELLCRLPDDVFADVLVRIEALIS